MMKTKMQETSLMAYFSEILPKLGKKQSIVFSCIAENCLLEGITNMEIADKLDWSINRVTPRVFELRKMGAVEMRYKRVCFITGKCAIAWKKADNVSYECMKPENFVDGSEYL